jgi:copper chaperone CopZ
MAEVRYHVPEIHCGGCVETIRKAILVLSGIERINAEVETHRVDVQYDPAKTTPAAIRERIVRAGFDVE